MKHVTVIFNNVLNKVLWKFGARRRKKILQFFGKWSNEDDLFEILAKEITREINTEIMESVKLKQKPVDTQSVEYVTWMANIWKQNDERSKGLRYHDGTIKTFYPGRSDLNKFGYPHKTNKCPECGEWECDPDGIGHYR